MNFDNGRELQQIVLGQLNKQENCNGGHSLHNRHVSLRQWAIFEAVVSSGSFANAAKVMHVSQPAVSYTIAKMEEQVGFPLLKVIGRKAQITEKGLALLGHGRHLLEEASAVERYVDHLRSR